MQHGNLRWGVIGLGVVVVVVIGVFVVRGGASGIPAEARAVIGGAPDAGLSGGGAQSPERQTPGAATAGQRLGTTPKPAVAGAASKTEDPRLEQKRRKRSPRRRRAAQPRSDVVQEEPEGGAHGLQDAKVQRAGRPREDL